MAYNVLEAISEEERLNFSQNFSVKRPGILDTIFPDVKTDYWKAEYYRLMSGQRLPEIAFVHALDTEAEIGSRPGFEKVLTEKLLIKRKLNQSESLQQAIENGVPDNEELTDFVFDDATNLFEAVLARTKVMKGQALSTGKLVIKENKVDMTIDFGVPSELKITITDWSKPDSDIMGDIQKMVQLAEDGGYVVNKAITSLKMINNMRNNTGMQTAVLGAANKRLLTKQELRTFSCRSTELQLIAVTKNSVTEAKALLKQVDISKKMYLPCMNLTRMALLVLDFGAQHQRKKSTVSSFSSKTVPLLPCPCGLRQIQLQYGRKLLECSSRLYRKLTAVS